MALINRVARLFKADFHAVLDHIEEPEQMLRQAIRDMEEELAALEQRLAAALLEQGSLCQRETELNTAVDEFDDKLDFCFDSGKDDLARSLVRRKLEAGQALKHVRARLEASEDHVAGQKKQLDESRSQLEALRQKAEILFSSRPAGAESIEGLALSPCESSVTDADVEIAFLREKSQRSLA